MALQHLRSSTADKRPTPAVMSDGQLAMNTNLASPGLFLKDSNGDLVKIGPVHVGTTAPNATPGAGGQAGNSKGEQWLDTTGGVYVFKIYDGTAWRSETGTFVDVNGDTMTGALGIIAGSAAAPGVFFSGDTNTGIYSPGADQVAVSTGGTGRLVIDANGTVTCTSAQPTDGSIRISNTTTRAPSNKYGIRFADSASETNAAIYAEQASSGNNASALVFGTNDGTGGGVLTSAAERLRITPAGLVGIGTGAPSEALHIASVGARISSSLIGGGASSLGLDYESSNARFISYGPDVSTQTGLIFLTANSTASTSIERLRITSAGLVGIGTSSPNYQLHVTTDFAVGASGFNQQLTFGNDTIQSLLLGTGYTALKLNPLGGNVGIGTTTAQSLLNLKKDANSTNPGNSASIVLTNKNTTLNGNIAGGIFVDLYRDVADPCYSGGIWFTRNSEIGNASSSTHIVFGAQQSGGSGLPSEKARINNAGNLLVGRTGTDGAALIQAPASSTVPSYGSATGVSTAITHFEFRNSNGLVGTISTNASATAYNTSSDYRLKENVSPVSDGIVRLQQLKPSRFNFIADSDQTVDGFIAHEVQAVVPECVTGEKDAVDDDGNPIYQGIDQSKLVPLLTAALQEAVARIEQLEAAVTALQQ